MIAMRNIILAFCLALVSFTLKASTVDTIAVSTTYLDSPENVIVITPDKSAVEACPSVYLLNGFGGNHLSWLSIRPDLPALADVFGMVFIMPDGRDSWYWDSPMDSLMLMESFITRDLVPFVDSHYNTIPSADKRAITGLSMGGHGAMWLAFRHPDTWRNVGSMSGGLDIRPFPERWRMKERIGSLASNPEIWDEHTVINLVPQIDGSVYNITFDCGVDDFFFDVNNAMHQALLEAGVSHDYTVRPGAHTASYWANSLPFHLLFFSTKM